MTKNYYKLLLILLFYSLPLFAMDPNDLQSTLGQLKINLETLKAKLSVPTEAPRVAFTGKKPGTIKPPQSTPTGKQMPAAETVTEPAPRSPLAEPAAQIPKRFQRPPASAPAKQTTPVVITPVVINMLTQEALAAHIGQLKAAQEQERRQKGYELILGIENYLTTNPTTLTRQQIAQIKVILFWEETKRLPDPRAVDRAVKVLQLGGTDQTTQNGVLTEYFKKLIDKIKKELESLVKRAKEGTKPQHKDITEMINDAQAFEKMIETIKIILAGKPESTNFLAQMSALQAQLKQALSIKENHTVLVAAGLATIKALTPTLITQLNKDWAELMNIIATQDKWEPVLTRLGKISEDLKDIPLEELQTDPELFEKLVIAQTLFVAAKNQMEYLNAAVQHNLYIAQLLKKRLDAAAQFKTIVNDSNRSPEDREEAMQNALEQLQYMAYIDPTVRDQIISNYYTIARVYADAGNVKNSQKIAKEGVEQLRKWQGLKEPTENFFITKAIEAELKALAPKQN